MLQYLCSKSCFVCFADRALQISKALLGDDDRLKLKWDEPKDAEVGAGTDC
jgi:hypothetical protein